MMQHEGHLLDEVVQVFILDASDVADPRMSLLVVSLLAEPRCDGPIHNGFGYLLIH